MVHFNHCLLLFIYIICIKQINSLPLQSDQVDEKFTISGPQLYPEMDMNADDVDYNKVVDTNNMSDGINADNIGADVGEQFAEFEWSPAKRSERQSRDLRGRYHGRDKYGGISVMKFAPLKRKLKAGEIVKLLERIAERRGIAISNKALRYGISRRSVD